MTEAPSHLIDLGGGRTRVLRLAIVDGRCAPLRYLVKRDEDMCEVCGCTETRACMGGCGWADRTHTICTRCAAMETLLSGEDGDL